MGKQAITSKDTHMIPLEIDDKLSYEEGQSYTDNKWLNLPCIQFTSSGYCNLSILYHKLSVEETKNGKKLAIPSNIVVHPDYDIEKYFINDRIKAQEPLIKQMEKMLHIDVPKVACNINAYDGEGFVENALPIFNITTMTAFTGYI